MYIIPFLFTFVSKAYNIAMDLFIFLIFMFINKYSYSDTGIFA